MVVNVLNVQVARHVGGGKIGPADNPLTWKERELGHCRRGNEEGASRFSSEMGEGRLL